MRASIKVITVYSIVGLSCSTCKTTSPESNTKDAAAGTAGGIQITTRDDVPVAVAGVNPAVEVTPVCTGKPLALGEECKDPQEDELNRQITAAAVHFQAAQNPKKGTLSMRDFHPKSTACVAAVVQVERNIPVDLQQGFFAPTASPDRTGKFKAVVRFSNGSPAIKPDGTLGLSDDSGPDARAMALKVVGVNGTPLQTTMSSELGMQSQDFMMTNHPVFFLRNIQSAMKFFPALLKGNSLAGLDAHEREALIGGRKKIDDIFNETYWSQGAYRFGNDLKTGAGIAAKFISRPVACGSAPLASIDKSDPNFLRAVAQKRLETGNVCFALFVQKQLDPVSMPTEDPTIEWSETASVPVKLATVTIAAHQNVLDSARHTFCENLSFSPWNGIKEHKPLGAIGRIRQTAYSGISTKRRVENHVSLDDARASNEFFSVLNSL